MVSAAVRRGGCVLEIRGGCVLGDDLGCVRLRFWGAVQRQFSVQPPPPSASERATD